MMICWPITISITNHGPENTRSVPIPPFPSLVGETPRRSWVPPPPPGSSAQGPLVDTWCCVCNDSSDLSPLWECEAHENILTSPKLRVRPTNNGTVRLVNSAFASPQLSHKTMMHLTGDGTWDEVKYCSFGHGLYSNTAGVTYSVCGLQQATHSHFMQFLIWAIAIRIIVTPSYSCCKDSRTIHCKAFRRLPDTLETS